MKKILKYAILALAAVVFGACHEEEFIPNEELNLSRCLQPMNLNARVSSSKGDLVTFTWDVTKDAEVYVLTVLNADGSTYLKEEVDPSNVPCQKTLEADKTFTFNVLATAEGKDDSKLAEYGKNFKTFAVKPNLYMKVADRTSASVSFTWSKEVKDYADVDRIEVYLPGSDETVLTHKLSSDEISAAAATVDGLQAGKEYVFVLMYLSASRSQVDVWTVPSTEGFTEVSSLEGLLNAVKTEDAKILLKMEGSPYDIEALDLSAGFSLVGEEAADGTKPVVQGEFHIADTWAGNDLYFEGVEFNGGSTADSPSGFGFVLQNKNGGKVAGKNLGNITFKNCIITGYTKGLFYEWAQPVVIGDFVFDSCDIDGLNPDGTQGGDGLDIRYTSTIGKLAVTNCTVHNGFRTFIRNYPQTTGNPAAEIGSVEVNDNTIYNLCSVDNSNNHGLIAFSEVPGGFSFKNNLVIGMTGKSKFGSENANHKSLSDLGVSAANNWYYDVAETFFNEKWPASAGGFTALDENPCYNAPAGLFNLNPDSVIADKNVGASRWWTPYVEEPEDLTLLTLDGKHTWDLSNAKFFSGTIKKEMVRDFLYIGASENNPIVAENGMLNFQNAAVTNRQGLPSIGYLAFKVDVPGSVVIKAADPESKGNHFVVGVGPVDGSSITLKGGASALADMDNAQKIVISTITEESLVYVFPSGPVSLEQLAWSTDVTPVNTALQTPVPVATPDSFTSGEATDVVISWEPVPEAGSYTVIFNGKSSAVTEEPWEFTIGSTTTGMLDAGSYTVEVVANPAKGDIYNTESVAGVAAFAVLPKGGSEEGGELVVKTVDELISAIAAGKTEICLAPGTYELGTLVTVKDLKLKAQTGAETRPVINGAIQLAGLDQGNLVFEGLEFVGSSAFANAFAILNPKSDPAATNFEAASILIRDCYVHDYPKSVFYNPGAKDAGASQTTVGSLVIENNIISNCTTGQNTIDIRDGHYGEVRISENTFSSCAVSGADVFRIDDDQNGYVDCPVLEVMNNTFYNSGAASGKAVFYVRESFSTYKVQNNLFLGADGAAGKYSRNAVVKPQLKNNFFFNVGENWFTGDIAADGTTLASSPVKNAAAGDFTLVNALVMSCRAGASRWNPSVVPDTGDAFEVHNMEELEAALSAGKVELSLAAGEYSIGTLTVVPGLKLRAVNPADKPVLTGCIEVAGENLGTLVFENLVLKGSSTAANAFTMANMTSGKKETMVSAQSITVRNCEISDYSKSVFYNPAGNKTTPGPSETDIASVLFDNCYIHDCTSGQNTFDIRDGIYGMITVQNSTFVNCAVSGAEIFRMDNTQNGLVQCNGFVVRGNTFYNCSAASGKALFYVREDLATYSITRNVFLGTDTAAGLFARARVALGDGFIAPTLKENFFFGMGADIFGEKDDIKNAGTVLTASPVKDAAAGDFTLTNTLVMSCNAGDPRWNPAYGTSSPSDFLTVASADEFTAAVSAGKTNIEFAYSATPYVLDAITLAKDMNLRGKVTYGRKPVIQGSIKLAGNIGSITLENLQFKGDANNSNAITVVNKTSGGAAEDVVGKNLKIKGCDFSGYSKSVFYNPAGNKTTPGPSETDITSVLFTECMFTDCTSGQNTIDIRDGKYGVFTIEKSTFANCAVSGADVFRVDNTQNGLVQMGTLVIRDNTFYNCAAASGKAVLYVREDLEGYSVLRNLFVGAEGAAGLFARARVALGEGFIAPFLDGNAFYGMGENIFGEKDDIKEGYGTILETAPCADPTNGNFTTTLNIGDPRWNPASPNFSKKK